MSAESLSTGPLGKKRALVPLRIANCLGARSPVAEVAGGARVPVPPRPVRRVVQIPPGVAIDGSAILP